MGAIQITIIVVGFSLGILMMVLWFIVIRRWGRSINWRLPTFNPATNRWSDDPREKPKARSDG